MDDAREKNVAGDPQPNTAGDPRPDGEAEPVAPEGPARGRRRERRQSLRFDVDDSAAIHLVRVGSILRGRILDLSLSGCRIRTVDRLLLGIYTFVEVEFRHEGLPFRLAGVIQAVHDRNTVGIRFLDISERKREQLEELILDLQEIAGLPSEQTLLS